MKPFIAYQLSLEAARLLMAPLLAIERKDRDLHKQIRRAIQSLVLNLAEGNRRRGQDRSHLFRVASGSAAEIIAALELSEAWGYLSHDAVTSAESLLDQVLAILYRLTETIR